MNVDEWGSFHILKECSTENGPLGDATWCIKRKMHQCRYLFTIRFTIGFVCIKEHCL